MLYTTSDVAINSLHAGDILFQKFSRLPMFFSKISFRNTVSKCKNQVRRFVGSDLFPNGLQRSSAGDTSRQRVKYKTSFTPPYCRTLKHTFNIKNAIKVLRKFQISIFETDIPRLVA